MAPYNLLFIYTDEQAYQTLAAYGNTQIHMPHLNKLAEQSVVFDRAYVTQPVCTPSRSTLLTGLYPHTSGCTENNVPLPTSVPCLPEMMARRDYVTGHYGKWHLGDEIFPQHGFTHWCSVEDNYSGHYSPGRDRSARSDYHHFLIDHGIIPRNGQTFSRGEAARLPEEYGKPAFLAQEASKFIEEHCAQPFMLFVNFLEPHMPFFGPRDDQYAPAKIPLPANFDHVLDEEHPLKTRVFREAYKEHGHSGLPLKTTDDWRRLIANYWGLCSLVDTHVGTILQTLDKCGLADQTIVVFTSDHGDMMGSHRLLAKCVMFEEAIRVPMMIKLPGQRQERRVTGPVSQVDVVPTLLDLMEQPVPEHLQGKSLRPWLEAGGPTHHNEDVIVQWNGPNSGVVGKSRSKFRVPTSMQDSVTGEELAASVTDPVHTLLTSDGWKFNCSAGGERELYSLADDPHEMCNLAAAPEHQSRMAELLGRIHEWQQKTATPRP